jgi:septum site-determining protein MinC
VILLGDVNPGAEIIAQGDILVLGRLRGVAHAGYGDNIQAVVVALRMEATQLRIADYIARLPDPLPTSVPEVAYLKHGKICLTAIPTFLDTYKSH